MRAVHYYTVQREDQDDTEAEDFFSRMETVTDYGDGDVDYSDEVNKFRDWLVEMGERRGAQTQYFRHEGRMQAMPPDSWLFKSLGYDPMQVRLYCYRVTEKIVVLFNGDIKTPGPLTAQECPRVRPYFNQAVKIAQALDKCRTDKDWWPTGYFIDTYNDEPLEFEVQF